MNEIEVKEIIEEIEAESPAESFGSEEKTAAEVEKAETDAEEMLEILPDAPEEDSRDYSGEVKRLLEYCPELKGQQIPEEVVAEFTNGRDLVQAYREYERRSYIKQYGDNAKMAREIYARQHNSEAAMKAPVKGVYGGGAADTSPSDDFLAGFNADNW